MANKIILKKSSVASKVPLATDLEVGEISVNLTDQKLYSKNASGTVILVGQGISGDGDVVGGSSSTDNAIARYDGTTGKLIQNSPVTISDTGAIAGAESISNIDFAQFDTTVTPTEAVGKLQWDDGNGTLQFGLKGGNVNLQVGQEIVARVYNDTGSALSDGQIVYISGAQGNRIAVKLAKADSELTSAGTLGMVTEPIASGAEGFITMVGTVNKLNTTGLTAGALIYLSATTAGAYTTTAPTSPNHRVTLGYVERVDNIVGSIYVKVDNGYELDELHNVVITSPSSGNTLIYDASSGIWKNANLTDGTGISITEGAGSITITNTAPDQTIGLTAGTGISVSGTYPDFTITNTASASGDVVGAASSTDNAIARYDGTTGKLIQDSAVTIDDTTGSIKFTGSSARIIGDFSNSTFANRTMFQSSTTNGATGVGSLPNGTNTTASFRAYGTSDPANSPYLTMSGNGANYHTISSSKSGTASALGLLLSVDGNSGVFIDTAGNVGINTTSPTSGYKLDIVGNAKFGGAIDETVYTVSDAAGVAISPANGTIQTWTLGASRTPTAGTWNAGESITLMINDGTAYTVTWTTIGVTWVGGTAPTLATTGYTVVELWKVGSTIYGAYVGAVA